MACRERLLYVINKHMQRHLVAISCCPRSSPRCPRWRPGCPSAAVAIIYVHKKWLPVCVCVCVCVCGFLYFTLLCCGYVVTPHPLLPRATCRIRRLCPSFAQIAAICCCFSKLLCLFRVRRDAFDDCCSLQLFMIIDSGQFTWHPPSTPSRHATDTVST